MYSVIENIEIECIAAAVTCDWQSLSQLSNERPDIIQKFIKKTGVEGRYTALPRQTTSDFCYAAAKKILDEKHIDKYDVGVLVFVSQSTDYRVPATACVLQHRLGLEKELIAFDVNLGCSGYVNGLNIVGSLMKSSNAKYGLLLAGDTAAREFSQKYVTKTDHSSSLLFGDAGTATLLTKSDNKRLDFELNTDGDNYEAIFAPYGFWRNPEAPENQGNSSRMDDIGVFNFATGVVPKQILKYMNLNNCGSDNYDCLVLHQANLMIMKRIAKKTGFSLDKLLVSMNRFANTSSASIPITLVNEYGEQNIAKEINVLCSGFGVGLSWATTSFSIRVNNILPLVHTNEYYIDGYNLSDFKEDN